MHVPAEGLAGALTDSEGHVGTEGGGDVGTEGGLIFVGMGRLNWEPETAVV